ncbi:MAG: DUF3622 domain-containing protein [Gammaproteobacteria bacterium]|nr:MAG: DUF3622 domain-containing protein [Gammaproteobacteria bacterium]
MQDAETWRAEITRRVSSKRSTVSKSQDGFATEAEAKKWAEEELKAFLKKLNEQNKRRAEQRES